MSNPIDLYCGEFTTSPVPLEVSLNYCSHSCHYCFANLNNPTRTSDMPGIMRQLARVPDGASLQTILMRAGCPVLVSNRVDPFALSNYQQAVPMLETMTEMGIPFAIQTRGGRGIDDVLKFAPPSVWYVSIAHTDDADRKRVEPGAPPLGERYELIQKLKAHGHRVVLGLNPLVREWVPDPDVVLARAKECGAEGVWVEALHFSHRQTTRMGDKGQAAITLPVIGRAMKKIPTPDDLAHYTNARRSAVDMGLEVMSIGQSCRSDFWRPFQETYETTFPVMQDFVNACWDTLGEGDVIDFDTFAEFFVPSLPEGEWPIDCYIGAKARDLFRDHKIPTKMTYEQLLAVIWSEPRLGFSPSRLRCFAYAGEKTPEGWLKIVDDRGLPFLVFTREECGTDEYYTEVN